MENKYLRLSPGTVVKTTMPNWKIRKEWSDIAWESRRWGANGIVVTHHDSHGLWYEVRHEDGSIGHYDPTEIEVAKQ